MAAFEVIPQVYQVTVNYANIFVIAEEKLTLIDTGYFGSSGRTVKFIKSLGRSPREVTLIILTHNHLDHSGSLEEWRRLTDAKTAAPYLDLALEDGIIPYPRGRYLAKVLNTRPMSKIKHHFVLKPDDVDILLRGSEEFPVLGGLKVVPTPGHTAGSLSLYSPKRKIIFVADALNNRSNILRLPIKTETSDMDKAVSSVKMMAEMDLQTICTGHGKPVTVDAKGKLSRLVKKLDNGYNRNREN